MASLPVEKGDHFTESVDQNWIKVSPIIEKKSEKKGKKYRQRSGAFAKHHQIMTNPAPSRIITGFVVEEPGEDVTDEVDGDHCSCCLAMTEELAICTKLNESLLKKFSRIMQVIDKGKKLIEGFEREFGLKPPLDGKTKPVFVASQNICLMDEEDKKKRRESGLEYTNVDLTSNMFPASDQAISLSEIDCMSRKLYQYLDECREISVSSANSCFESRFSFSKIDTSTFPRNKRPPLQRMHTLSNASDISRYSSNIEHSLELGMLGKRTAPSQQPFLPHYHSEQRPNERMNSLRRTHSENELLASDLESRVLLIESNSPITTKEDEIALAKVYNRVFSSPGNHPSHDQVSHDQLSNAVPFRSHLMSVLRHRPSINDSILNMSQNFANIVQPLDNSAKRTSDDLKNLEKGLTGEESMQILEKITNLEQHRLNLLTELETMKEKNNAFWETLEELREELDEKDFCLKILSGDVRLATREMNIANETRKEAMDLKKERDRLSERLRNLEDEHTAVKESLVQLVTEKAATNKALTIENQRLRQKVKHLPNQNSQTDLGDGEPLSAEDEFRMQGLFAELNGSDYVHKQGFLVKQGHKVKNWRRRMFVLDTHALSYYKTEQPLGTVPLEEITKVQVAHSSFKLPYMFEIHRNDPTQKNERVYFLSAPTHDEMQSWIGIIQTLKDTKRQSIRHSTFVDFDSSPVGSPEKPNVLATSFGTGKGWCQTQQNSLTLPSLDRSTTSRQRQSVIETGVRNRMFTDTGQRRTDISMDTSDEEDNRSPLSISSDEDIIRDESSYRLKYSKKT